MSKNNTSRLNCSISPPRRLHHVPINYARCCLVVPAMKITIYNSPDHIPCWAAAVDRLIASHKPSPICRPTRPCCSTRNLRTWEFPRKFLVSSQLNRRPFISALAGRLCLRKVAKELVEGECSIEDNNDPPARRVLRLMATFFLVAVLLWHLL